MNVFQIKNDNCWNELTIDNYIHLTKRKKPYFKEIKDKKISYFAICPACQNPIQIINFHKKSNDEGKVTTLYAKHYNKSIENLANYNKSSYLNCSLGSQISFNSKKKIINKDKENEIISFLEKHKKSITYFIRYMTGINFSPKKIENILDEFILTEGYYFTYVSKYNLPFSILYLSNNQNLFMQYIKEEEIKLEFSKSLYFKISEDGQVIPKDKSIYSQIGLYFSNFKVRRINNSSIMEMMLNIEESAYKKSNLFYRKIITFDINHFWNIILKEEREK